MKYPVPTHLREIYKLDMDKTEPDWLFGKLQCTCGCGQFRMLHNNCEDREHSLKLQADCAGCGKRWLVLDEALQGYDGFVCHDGSSAPDSELRGYFCPSCGQMHVTVTLAIEPEDFEQFREEILSEYPDEFTAEDYVDAFGWITVSLACTACGCQENGWVDLELS